MQFVPCVHFSVQARTIDDVFFRDSEARGRQPVRLAKRKSQHPKKMSFTKPLSRHLKIRWDIKVLHKDEIILLPILAAFKKIIFNSKVFLIILFISRGHNDAKFLSNGT